MRIWHFALITAECQPFLVVLGWPRHRKWTFTGSRYPRHDATQLASCLTIGGMLG
jgi:hypothetical protein